MSGGASCSLTAAALLAAACEAVRGGRLLTGRLSDSEQPRAVSTPAVAWLPRATLSLATGWRKSRPREEGASAVTGARNQSARGARAGKR
jgi:hypothetical protein